MSRVKNRSRNAKRLGCLLTAFCLAGCAAPGEPVGEVSLPDVSLPDVSKTNFGMFVGIDAKIEAQMADEAALQLWHIIPPPLNLPEFQQRIPDTDSFGRLLATALQRDGWFVRQWHDPAVAPQCGQKLTGKSGNNGGYRVVPVCYLADDVSGMLRLTLFVAGDAWSRFFNTHQGKLVALGAWTQQKGK